MPDTRLQPDLSDAHRCISVHWSIPAQCALPASHEDNWHVTTHPETGRPLRYRYAIRATETPDDEGAWRPIENPTLEPQAQQLADSGAAKGLTAWAYAEHDPGDYGDVRADARTVLQALEAAHQALADPRHQTRHATQDRTHRGTRPLTPVLPDAAPGSET